MSGRNTLLFGAALAVTTAAIAADHLSKPVPPRPVHGQTTSAAAAAPCAAGAPIAAPCAAGAPAAKATPPPPPAQRPGEAQKLAPPPPPAQAPVTAPALRPAPAAPLVKPEGEEAPDLVVQR